jgi:Reverse transcriptase (RNA-dependent DNA polymerase).
LRKDAIYYRQRAQRAGTWDRIRNLGSKRGAGKFVPRVTTLRRRDGSMCDSSQVVNVYAGYLQEEVYDEPDMPFSPCPHADVVREPLPDSLNAPFDRGDLRAVIKQLKLWKSRKPNGVLNEMIKLIKSCLIIFLLFLEIFNLIFTTARIPLGWIYALIAMLPKLGGQRGGSKSPRPVSLIDTICKVFVRLLCNRLTERLKDRIRKTQYAYQKGKHGTDAVVFVIMLLEHHHELSDKSLEMLFLDLDHAFDRVRLGSLIHCLERLGVHGYMLDILTVLQ